MKIERAFIISNRHHYPIRINFRLINIQTARLLITVNTDRACFIDSHKFLYTSLKSSTQGIMVHLRSFDIRNSKKKLKIFERHETSYGSRKKIKKKKKKIYIDITTCGKSSNCKFMHVIQSTLKCFKIGKLGYFPLMVVSKNCFKQRTTDHVTSLTQRQCE